MDTPFSQAEIENLQAMKRAVLKARARMLAKPHKRIEIKTDLLEVVEFVLAGETYAIPTSEIREVHYLKDVAKLPSSPNFIVGMVNLRGQIILVIDIRRFFELPQSDFAVFNKLIVIEKKDTVLGLTADEVIGVREIEQTSIHPSLPSLAGKRARFIHGITTDRVTILDVEKMLQDKELMVNEQALDGDH